MQVGAPLPFALQYVACFRHTGEHRPKIAHTFAGHQRSPCRIIKRERVEILCSPAKGAKQIIWKARSIAMNAARL